MLSPGNSATLLVTINIMTKNPKNTFSDFVRRAVEVHGDRYIYAEDTYTGMSELTAITCTRHGLFLQKPTNHVAQGQGCRKCSDLARGEISRGTLEVFLKQASGIHGAVYDLSKVVYATSKTKVEIVCRDHGSFWVIPNNFISNKSGCPQCGRTLVGQRSRHDRESYLARFREAHGNKFKYGEIDYSGPVATIVVTCPDHGDFKTIVAGHVNGIGCAKCHFGIYDGPTFKAMADGVHGDRYDYSNAEYTRCNEKVVIRCRVHGDFKQAPSEHVHQSQGCPRCAFVGPSKGQSEMFGFVRAIKPDAVMDYMFGAGKKELDIFIPSLMLGIEFDGLPWHSDWKHTDNQNINTKHTLARKQGIRVISIFSDEWELNQSVVEKTLLHVLGVSKKVYARNTEVVEVDASTAADFFTANHIQGFAKGCVSVGLEHDGTLIAAMSFSPLNSHRGIPADPSTVELRRYASTGSVVGGASRLFQAYLGANPGVTKVISYSDNRMFTGEMYGKMGFTNSGTSRPDYFYVRNPFKVRHRKSNFTREKLALIAGFDPMKTEKDNMVAMGWNRIYDCGKTKWTWLRT